MMSAAFKVMGVRALYAALYVDELARDLDLLHKAGYSGLSVTVPYKEIACRLSVEVDQTAEDIGAVNTLLRDNHGWQGRNTDWIGALRAISRVTEIGDRNALVLGAGGAARAVAYALKRAGAHVTISNRCVERGRNLSEQFRCNFVPLNSLEKNRAHYDIVAQCTSVGLTENRHAALVSNSFFQPGMTVMDIVYGARPTAFSTSARNAGCSIVSGLDMLLYQGAAQLEWWLGRPVPDSPVIAAMRQALEESASHEEPR